MDSGTVTRSPYIDARTTDSTNGIITEDVISTHGSKFGENIATMSVVGNRFTMTESTGTVTGQGELIGQPWNWLALTGEFNMSAPNFKMRIVDYNLFAGPSSIMGHKDVYQTVGSAVEKLTQHEDVVLHLVDQITFNKKKTELLGQ